MFGQLVDEYGRKLNYLRVSLTEHCNFRCVYCLPHEGLSLLPASQTLTRQEIVRFVALAGRLGIKKVRLTGGEPLLRKDLLEIVRDLKKIPTLEDLSITTNGSLLSPLVYPLKEAGLTRLNISLDSLNANRFAQITLSDVFEKVLAATHLSLQAGFPVKLNMVVMQGLSFQDIFDYVRLAVQYPLDVRFLEFMPLCGSGWETDKFMPIARVREIVETHFSLSPELPRGDAPAQTFQLQNGKGKVGFIASISEPFCKDCSRLRLSADGKIRPCLFSTLEFSVKDLLRNGASDETVIAAIHHAVSKKPKGNQFDEKPYAGRGERPEIPSQTPYIHAIGG